MREWIGFGGRPAPRRAARDAGDDYGATASPDWREIDWREHLRQAEIAGRRVNYVDIGSGDGAPVVFVHGLGGCWQNWLENLPRVAQERRAVALDLPGFGHSEMPADKISIRGYARCVDALCEQLDLGRVVVVGNSMGGFVTAEMGIGAGQRCERLVLVAAAGISVTNLRRRPVVTASRVFGAASAYVAAHRAAFVRRPGLRHAIAGYVMRHPTLIKPDLMYEQVAAAASPGFIQALDALTDYDFRDRLGEVRCPTLLVWGRNDHLVPVDDADEYERLLPSARKVIIDDTGHVPMLERPRKFNELLLEFLSEPAEAPAAEAPATADVSS